MMDRPASSFGIRWHWPVVLQACAALSTASIHAATSVLGADAVVLVNSSSAKYSDFQRLIQPYLDNFGVPYTVQDLIVNPVTTNISTHALVIIGHRQLDTNHAYLNLAAQGILSSAVSNGMGLVNFDADLVSGTTPRYQFIQDIFGFTYGSAGAGTSVTFPATQPGGQMHYVTSRHTTNDSIALRASVGLSGLILPTNTTAVVLSGGKSLVSVTQYGLGRAVHWASLDWMVSPVLGPLAGLDDVIWRGMTWAARKPFVLRGMPNFVTMRVDDVAGPLWWVHIANESGFKPFLAIFISDLSQANLPDLRSLITNGNASTCPHAFGNSSFIYFNHAGETAYSDVTVSNNLYAAAQWHVTNSIPFPKIIATHYSEIGANAFAGLLSWGVEYVPIEVVPGTVEYVNPGAPWLIGGPYRLYETPLPGQTNLPLYYADTLAIPGHPELAGKFFNCYTEIRDIGDSCGEWCPDNSNVAASIARGAEILKRGMNSMVLATVFTHDWYIQNTPGVPNARGNPITTNNWRAIIQGISNNIASYQPTYVTLEYGNQYARATRTSRITASQFDSASGEVSVTLTGRTDLAISVQIFTGNGGSITSSTAAIPAFTNSVTVTATATPLGPSIFSAPQSRTNDAGSVASFSVQAGGTPPLTYRWWSNGTNFLADGGAYSGTSTATLTLSNVLGINAAAYTVMVSNSLGTVTSTPPASLTVNDPLITVQPVSRINHANTPAGFVAGAIGTTPGYQWLRNGNPIGQATSPILNLPSVTSTDAGLYSVMVSNLYGMVPSATATLSVVSGLAIQSILVASNRAAITWSAIPSSNYTLQYKQDLATPEWSSAATVSSTATVAVATNLLGNSTQRFYRVLMP